MRQQQFNPINIEDFSKINESEKKEFPFSRKANNSHSNSHRILKQQPFFYTNSLRTATQQSSPKKKSQNKTSKIGFVCKKSPLIRDKIDNGFLQDKNILKLNYDLNKISSSNTHLGEYLRPYVNSFKQGGFQLINKINHMHENQDTKKFISNNKNHVLSPRKVTKTASQQRIVQDISQIGKQFNLSEKDYEEIKRLQSKLDILQKQTMKLDELQNLNNVNPPSFPQITNVSKQNQMISTFQPYIQTQNENLTQLNFQTHKKQQLFQQKLLTHQKIKEQQIFQQNNLNQFFEIKSWDIDNLDNSLNF